MSTETAYNWDDEIVNDGEEFALLPDGVYPFVIEKFARGRFNGSDKVPACNQANVTIRLLDESGGKLKTIEEKLKLTSNMEWILCAFFRCLGLRKEGEKLKMCWTDLVGKCGIVKIGHREYENKKKELKVINGVDKWLPPEDATAPATSSSSYTAGEF